MSLDIKERRETLLDRPLTTSIACVEFACAANTTGKVVNLYFNYNYANCLSKGGLKHRQRALSCKKNGVLCVKLAVPLMREQAAASECGWNFKPPPLWLLNESAFLMQASGEKEPAGTEPFHWLEGAAPWSERRQLAPAAGATLAAGWMDGVCSE
jgi:hypothetical protein